MTLAATDRWVRIGLSLVVITMAYNVVEAGLALWAGVRAGSVVLVGFGLDSIIEVAAASVLLWRLSLESRGVPQAQLAWLVQSFQVAFPQPYARAFIVLIDEDDAGFLNSALNPQ